MHKNSQNLVGPNLNFENTVCKTLVRDAPLSLEDQYLLALIRTY